MFKPYAPREVGTTSEVVSRLIADTGGVKRTALLLERSLTQIYSYSDPTTPDQISLDQVRRLVVAAGSPAPAEDLAALAGGLFLPLEAPPDDESFQTLAAKSAEEWGDFIAALLRAHADRHLERLAESDIRKKLDALLRQLGLLRAKLIEGEGRT